MAREEFAVAAADRVSQTGPAAEATTPGLTHHTEYDSYGNQHDYAAGTAPVSNNHTPTYLGDILPIMMKRCSRCHNPDSGVYINWLDYETAYNHRGEIRRRVWNSWRGQYFKVAMPIAHSAEDESITQEERQQIRNWVAAGGQRGVPPPAQHAKSKAEKMEFGRQMFTSICGLCHQSTGQGIPSVFPPLAGSDFLNADKKRAIKIVINGRTGFIVVNSMAFNNSMPSFPLNDDDIANVLTYVYNSFGNSGFEVNSDEVKLLRTEAPDQAPQGPVTTKIRVPVNPYE